MPNPLDPAPLLAIYVLAAAVFAAAERQRLSSTIARAGRPAAYFVVLSVCGLLVAQTYVPSGSLYPFAAWTMYTERAPERSTWRVEFVRASGAREVIPVARVLPGPEPRAAMRHITVAAWRLETASDEARDEKLNELEELLEAVAELDARRHSSDAVTQIEIERCRIEGDPPWNRRSFVCGPFFVHDVRSTVHADRHSVDDDWKVGGQRAP